MTMLKKLGIILSTAVLATGLQVARADDAAANNNFKIAIVNVQQVLQQSPRVAQLSKKLEGEFKARQTKISDQQKALQDEGEQFKKDSVTMSQKDRTAKQNKMAAKRAELVKQVVGYQQDVQKEQTKIMQNILNDLNGIVQNIAKDQHFNLVLDSQAVIFAGNGTDITKDVAKGFNDKS